MILVRKRGTHHVEMHNDIDLDAFMDRTVSFGELRTPDRAEIYFNAEAVIVAFDNNDLLPQYAKYLMDVIFFENMDTEYSE